ncbi:MAG TPA: hypothetical protein PKB06_03305, partial [Actinotalea sp.]|nr:hypothetical protein [Actinotalea sp.]
MAAGATATGDAPVRHVPLAVALVGGGLVGALLLGSAAAPAQVSPGDVPRRDGVAGVGDGPLVVVGTAGVRWADVDRSVTPTLWALVRDGASVGGVAPGVTTADRRCVAAGWLALSAGQPVVALDEAGEQGLPWSVMPSGDQAGAAAQAGAATPVGGSVVAGAVVEGWSDLVRAQSRSAFVPRLGELGEALAGARCSTAVGAGAALALAGRAGEVDRFVDLETALADPAAAFSCPLTVVDVGATPFAPAPRLGSTVAPDPLAPTVTGDGVVRDLALSRLDRTVRQVLSAAPDDATVLVVDMGNPSTTRPWLGVGAVAQGEQPGRYLSSASTRWQGVVRLLDVPSSITSATGVAEPAEFTGSPLASAGARPVDVSEVVDGLADVSSRDQALRGLSGWLTGTPLVVALVLLGLVWVLGARAGPGVRARLTPLRRTVDLVLLVLASLPAGMYLMTTWSWWRADQPVAAMWLSLGAATLVVAGLAALAPRRPAWAGAALVAGITFAVLTLDAILGTPLHRGSTLGPSPTLGGRYYGFGNPTYSVYAVAALVTAAALGWWLREQGRRVAAVLAAGAVGVTALLVDLLPGLGADVGGGLVLLPAAGIVVLAVAGARVTWTRVLLIGAVGVVLVAGIGVLDWSRPAEQRTHLGRFV